MRSLFVLPAALVVLAGCVDEDLGGIVTQVTQVHHQGGGAADLLFVIDSSLSMDEEQRALGNGFDTFIEGFVALQYDFRIAVTTMDVINDGGALRGPVLAPDTPNLATQFREQVNVGVNGLGIEQGLEGAKRALDNLQASGDFLRQGATLTIIFVSDEDDQSPSTLDHYLDFFVRKKDGDERRVRISAITGPRTGGCSEAGAGFRYLDLVEQTGGAFASICQSDLGLGDLGAEISGFKTSFPLEQRVDEGEPVVFVDGVEVNGFVFEGDQVRFTPGTEPGQCAVVEIAYFTRDFTDTGGEPVVLEPTPAVCQNIDIGERPGGIQGGCTQTSGGPLWMLLLGLLFGIKLRSGDIRRFRR